MLSQVEDKPHQGKVDVSIKDLSKDIYNEFNNIEVAYLQRTTLR
jgi:hypothetical protein